jgi:O-antigen ligase
VCLLAWILFAFGGYLDWTIVVFAVAVVAAAAFERAPIAARPYTALDLALLACIAAMALQLFALPPDVRAEVAPGSILYDAVLRFQAAPLDTASVWRPTTLDVGATRMAILTAASMVLLFWTARSAFRRGGLRAAVRSVAWLGLMVSVVGMLTHATSPTRSYWLWQLYPKGARPYGPFGNRNDLACWLAMAIPLTAGYAVARAESRGGSTGPVTRTIDATTVWLGAALFLMLAGLLASTSRSGFAASAIAVVCFAALGRHALTRRRVAAIAIGLVTVLILAATYANVGEIASKMQALQERSGMRPTIWRFTLTMAHDFWPAGTGAGAYTRGIVLYQQPFELTYVNHAHNQALQWLAEGGALLVVPAALAALCGLLVAAKRLREDRTPIYWIRAGAVSGIAALAVHGLFEAPLRLPANAALFAVLAAVAVHENAAARRGAA